MSIARVATCNLNQWALDFDGNFKRIMQSIRKAKDLGARYRVGPELEISGYGCEDHFLEQDTFLHSMDVLCQILDSTATEGIIVDVGMPLMHKGVAYNCRVFCVNHQIVLIRPKLYLANDGNYRETRWFTTWKHTQRFDLESHVLTARLRKITGQQSVPFGFGVVRCLDTTIAAESCEEMFTPHSPHIELGLDGVEIFSNGSGSHTQLRKLHQRVDLIMSATAKGGGAYLYANQQGCDGGRLYYDGCALVSMNGKLLAQASQFSVRDVEVITAAIDLQEIRSYRGAIASRSVQASVQKPIPFVDVPFQMTTNPYTVAPTMPIPLRCFEPSEEIGYGPAAWLWDFLRRSGSSGFFIPLSGGADSAAVATIVGIMCNMVMTEAKKGNNIVCKDILRITGRKSLPANAKELANHVLHTCYLGTVNSSNTTRARAKALAEEIGGHHLDTNIDSMVDGVLSVFEVVTGKMPRFMTRGGTATEDVALQNIQARLRMVMSYMLAQLLPWVRRRKGWLLVLGTGNVDEALRGYLTKYDCSAADINPIGAVSKVDLIAFLSWAGEKYGFKSLHTVVNAPPSAELRPLGETLDEGVAVDAASLTSTPPKTAGGDSTGTASTTTTASTAAAGTASGAGAGAGAGAGEGAAADGAATPMPASAVTSKARSIKYLRESKFVKGGAPKRGRAASTADGDDDDDEEGVDMSGEYTQTDEADMGMSYAELSRFGTLRKVNRCGPVSMFRKLVYEWSDLPPTVVAEKVKRFFLYYGINRHKTTVLTPSYHAEAYSADDNRFDLRPFLYNSKWDMQFRQLDSLAAKFQVARDGEED